jgi:mono/diheme cytochrome c family protein
MKKVLLAGGLMIMIWGCSKKMTPSTGQAPASNSGSVVNNSQPMSADGGKSVVPAGSSTTTTTTTTTASTGDNATAAGARTAAPTGLTPEAAAAIAGQKTYNAKCGSCHGLKVTTDFTSDRWASILAVMAPKAQLTETEKNNVYAYVKENSKPGK